MTATATIITDHRIQALNHGLVLTAKRRPVDAKSTGLADALGLELVNLGYRADPAELRTLTPDAMREVLDAAKSASGADREFVAFYPSFPEGVQNRSDVELFIDQITHYFSVAVSDAVGEDATYTPERFGEDSPTIREGLPVADALRAAKPLRLVSGDGALRELLAVIVGDGVAMSGSDARVVAQIVQKVTFDAEQVGEIVTASKNRENVQRFLTALRDLHGADDGVVVAALDAANHPDLVLRVLLTFYGVASIHDEAFDRAINALSNRDAKAVLTASVPNRVRRRTVVALGRTTAGFRADALVSREALWRAVLYKMHPFALPNLSAGQRRALDIIHGNIEHRTLNSLIEDAMADEDIDTAVELMVTHSRGSLLRRVVALLRMCNDTADVMKLTDALAVSINTGVPMTTLLSAYNGVLAAGTAGKRVVRMAGRANHMIDREAMPKAMVNDVLRVLRRKITEKLAQEPAREGVVATGSDNPVPLVRRDLSDSDRVIERGEKITPIGSGDTLRLFVQWFNGQGRVDLDLGALLMDADFEVNNYVTWNSYGGRRRCYATYSGDMTDASGAHGAAEFIDIDLPALREEVLNEEEADTEWVAMTVLSYTGQPLESVEHFAGAMYRSKPNSGQTFEPTSVASAFTSVQKSTNIVPLVVNINDGRVIWVDTSTGENHGGRSITNNSELSEAVRDEVARPRLSIRELMEMYATAHGLDTDESADSDRALLRELLAL